MILSLSFHLIHSSDDRDTDSFEEVIGFGDLWGPSGTSGDHLGPLGTIWGPSGDHLGHGFDEVIDFITESDLPECADRSV